MQVLRAGFAGILLLAGNARADEFTIPENTEKAQTSPHHPADVLRSVKLPPGFKLSLVAAEPDVQNPIALTTDERGRLWVAENYSWSGRSFDGTVRDRIVIFEDTNGDGTFDKRTVFWDEARKLTSLEVGDGGIWALCLPHLLFIPDANCDDIPDGPPRIILDGIDEGSVGHTPANGLKWGPDGWLYARHGILATSSIGKPGASESQRFKINTGVWRYHPTREVAEAVMHGMTNSWGFDFNEFGELFVINTVIGHLWHVVPGTHTERMFGLDINPHSYQLIQQVADHVHWDTGEVWSDVRKGVTNTTNMAGGGHAHIGLMIYQGNNWPAEYRGRAYMLNLHGMRLNSDYLQRKGTGYTATHGPDLCFISDPWYRGMDLITGPDGSVFIADWSDTGECHDHDGVHRTSGRLYKLSFEEPAPVPTFDLKKKSNEELIACLTHPNTWWARQSRRILTQRAQHQLVTDESTAILTALRTKLDATQETVSRIRILEAIATAGEASPEWWTQQLAASSEHERVTALKFLIDTGVLQRTEPAPGVMQTFLNLAENDPSGLVQLYLASALQRLPTDQRWELAEKLAAHAEYADDRMFPLMVWYGIEPAVIRTPVRALIFMSQCRLPLVTEFIARRLTLEIERDPASVEHLLQQVLKQRVYAPERVVKGMAAALNGWQKATAPECWPKVAALFEKSQDEQIRKEVQNLNVVFGDGRTLNEIREMVINNKLPAETRQQALRALMIKKPDNYVSTLLNLTLDHAVAVEALKSLAQYDVPEIPQKMIEFSPRYDAAERAEMVQTLISRPESARVLLTAIRNKRIAATELSAFHARQIASFENQELTDQLKELWGDVRVSAAEKRTLIDSHKQQLTPDLLAKADLSAGRALFQKTCASCHVLYGSGRRLGPDITGSNRKNLDYLLENMIDPSASVGADFRTVVIQHEDGRVLNGVISELNERTLTLLSANETITLDRQKIEEMKTTQVSLMPEGQLQNLSSEQVRNLIGYLMGSEQVPLPAE